MAINTMIDEQPVKNRDFMEFVNKEFDETIEHATIEDMAVFAFGSMEEALEEFEAQRSRLG